MLHNAAPTMARASRAFWAPRAYLLLLPAPAHQALSVPSISCSSTPPPLALRNKYQRRTSKSLPHGPTVPARSPIQRQPRKSYMDHPRVTATASTLCWCSNLRSGFSKSVAVVLTAKPAASVSNRINWLTCQAQAPGKLRAGLQAPDMDQTLQSRPPS
jgi:hypothetical protein